MSVQRIEYVDEASWLAERRKRVTATDAARLANSKAEWPRIKAEKLGEGSTFKGNPYTFWGQAREPVIMQTLDFLFNIEPNQDLFVNGTRAATPDGISETRLAEAKTTGRDWFSGNDADTLANIRKVQPKYYDQVQFAQLVCERDSTVFAWEMREDVEGEFFAGKLQHIIIGRDEDRIKKLIEVEQQFLEYLNTDQDGGEWDDWMERYIAAEAEAREKASVVEEMKAELRERFGNSDEAVETSLGKINYTWPGKSDYFDAAAFRAENVELAKRYTEPREPTKATLRITTRK